MSLYMCVCAHRHICVRMCACSSVSVCAQFHEAQREKYNCLSSAFICLRQGVFLINHNVCQRSWPTIFWGCSLSLSEISDMGYHAMFLICVCVLGSYNSITLIHQLHYPLSHFSWPLSSSILLWVLVSSPITPSGFLLS